MTDPADTLTEGEQLVLRILRESERDNLYVFEIDGPTMGCAGNVNAQVVKRLRAKGLVRTYVELAR